MMLMVLAKKEGERRASRSQRQRIKEMEKQGNEATKGRAWLALGRAHTHEPILSQIRAPVDSKTTIMVNESKARERESLSLRQRDFFFLKQARHYRDKILAEAEKEEEKEERTFTITSLDELQLRHFMNEGIKRPAKGSTTEFQDYKTKSWD
nr:hypothetical protein [Tanacetum cinerariifolium]